VNLFFVASTDFTLAGKESWFWTAQWVGAVALLVNCGSFLLKSRSSILAWQILSSALWVVHFLLLGAPSAVMMNFLGVVRQTVFFYRGRSKHIRSAWWPIGFCTAFCLGGAVTWEGWPTLLLTVAMVFGTIALWQVETRKLRLLSMIPPPLWFAYNMLHLSFAGMLTELFVFFSQATGFFLHETKAGKTFMVAKSRKTTPGQDPKRTPDTR
jgi:hypothetical protein